MVAITRRARSASAEPYGGRVTQPPPTPTPRPWRWSARPVATPQRPPTYEVAAVVVLAAWNIVAYVVVPGSAGVVVNAVGVTLLLVLAHRSGADTDALGLRRSTLGRGSRVGAAAAGLVVLAVAAIAALPVFRPFLADSRFVGVSLAGLVLETTGRIPLSTALAEEIAFRGALLGMLLQWTSPVRAMFGSSLLFGLWHVLPAFAALGSSTAIGAASGPLAVAAIITGQVAVTTLAGVGFAWLRFRGDSVVAPALAHWGLNASAYVAGWLIVRNAWA